MHHIEVDPLEWLCAQHHDGFVGRVLWDTIVDHCVITNARGRLIVDSADIFLLSLNVKILQHCEETKDYKLQAGEIRKIVEQKKKHKNKRREIELVNPSGTDSVYC